MKWQRDLTRPEDRQFPTGTAVGDAEEDVMEYSLEELAEFLGADLADIAVDLEFKHSLREKLWELVRTRNRLRRRGPDGT